MEKTKIFFVWFQDIARRDKKEKLVFNTDNITSVCEFIASSKKYPHVISEKEMKIALRRPIKFSTILSTQNHVEVCKYSICFLYAEDIIQTYKYLKQAKRLATQFKNTKPVGWCHLIYTSNVEKEIKHYWQFVKPAQELIAKSFTRKVLTEKTLENI